MADGSEAFGSEASAARDTCQHSRADLLGIMEREDNVRPALARERLVRARLTLDAPPDSKQRGQDPPGLGRWPLTHAGSSGRAERHTDQIGARFAVLEPVG